MEPPPAAPPGRQVHLGVHEGSQTLALDGGKAGPLVRSPLLHGAAAFMFELADAKQEYSEMLNCSTKDWLAEQTVIVDRPPPKTPQQPQNGQCFLFGKLLPVF